jgi:hypothetical protein
MSTPGSAASLLAGVDEQRQPPPDEVERMLDLPLEVADQLEAVRQALLVQPVCRRSSSSGPSASSPRLGLPQARITTGASDTRTPAGRSGGAAQPPDHLPRGILQFELQRHLAERVRGARQAGVEGADGDFDVVEQALR